MTINISPAATIDFISKKNDSINFNFTVTDKNDVAVDFSGYTFAKMSLKTNELATEVISFSSTGSTYQIEFTDSSRGNFTIKCDSLSVPANEYLYDFQLINASQQVTVMQGRFNVIEDIT